MSEKARWYEERKVYITDTENRENFSQPVLYIFCFGGLIVLITFCFNL